jgi:hypothetical protein
LILQLLQDFFSCEAHELYAAAIEIDEPRLRQLRVATEKASTNNPLSAIEAGQLRPWVPRALWTWHPELVADDYVGQAGAAGAGLMRLQQYLLYCHEVAVANPLTRLWAPGRIPSLSWARSYLGMVAIYASYCGPLLETGVLRMVSSTLETAPQPLRAAAQSDDELLGAVSPTSEQKASLDTLRLAFDTTWEGLSASKRTGGSVHLLLASRHWAPLLTWLARRSDGGPAAAPADLRLAEVLASLEIPGLDGLSPSDIVAVRENDAFVAWRAALRSALIQVDALRPDQAGSRPGDAAALIDETLREARERVETRMGESRFLSAARSPARSFSIGAITAGAMATVFPPERALLTGALSSAADLVWSYAAARSRDKGVDHALHRHFLAFQPTMGSSWRSAPSVLPHFEWINSNAARRGSFQALRTDGEPVDASEERHVTDDGQPSRHLAATALLDRAIAAALETARGLPSHSASQPCVPEVVDAFELVIDLVRQLRRHIADGRLDIAVGAYANLFFLSTHLGLAWRQPNRRLEVMLSWRLSQLRDDGLGPAWPDWPDTHRPEITRLTAYEERLQRARAEVLDRAAAARVPIHDRWPVYVPEESSSSDPGWRHAWQLMAIGATRNGFTRFPVDSEVAIALAEEPHREARKLASHSLGLLSLAADAVEDMLGCSAAEPVRALLAEARSSEL